MGTTEEGLSLPASKLSCLKTPEAAGNVKKIYIKKTKFLLFLIK
jgi:hypothetical protein